MLTTVQTAYRRRSATMHGAARRITAMMTMGLRRAAADECNVAARVYPCCQSVDGGERGGQRERSATEVHLCCRRRKALVVAAASGVVSGAAMLVGSKNNGQKAISNGGIPLLPMKERVACDGGDERGGEQRGRRG